MKFEELVMKTVINLRGRDLTDANLVDLTKVLRESTVLKKLHLDYNDITLDNNGRVFTKALASNRTIEVLNLSWNKISSQGITLLAGALGDNKSLVEVYLSHNNIDENGCKALTVAFLKNRGNLGQVFLSDNEGTDAVSELINEITRLKKDYSSRMEEMEELKGKLQKCEDDME